MANTFLFRNPDVPLDKRVKHLVSLLTLDEKIESMIQYQPEIKRLGVRAYKHGTEAAHGMAWLGNATSFPQPIGLGCTWDTALMKQIGDAIGDEARVFYKQNPEFNGLTLWAPTVDMERDPRWGRTEESYGEDPVLTGELTAALVQGMQGDHPTYYKSIATLKHFIGNNNEVDRGSCSVTIDQRNMKEYYQAAFKIPFIKGGAKSMMTSYNAVNGIPTILLQDVKRVVKEEWGLNGFIVSDAGDLLGLVNDHHYFDTYKEAVAAAVKAGIDSITDDKEKTIAALKEALGEGLLTEAELDEALFNTFRVRFLLGEFDPPHLNPYESIPETKLMAPEHAQLSLEAAKKSIVLLKNEGQLLPLSPKTKVAVVGPLANTVYRDWYSGTMPYEITIADAIKQLASEVIVHDTRQKIKLYSGSRELGITSVDDEQQSLVLTDNEPEPFLLTDWDHGSFTLQRLNNKFVSSTLDTHLSAQADEAFGWFVKEIIKLVPDEQSGATKLLTWNNDKVVYKEATGSKLSVVKADITLEEDTHELFTLKVVEDGVSQAVEAAKQSEVAIVVIGNHPLINGKEEIDRPSLHIPRSQQELVKRVYEANKNTVVVIVSSYPYVLGDLQNYCASIVYLAHAGQEQGRAVAQMLFGGFSPSGRLNMTWYESEAQLSSIMDYDIRKSKRTYQYVNSKVTYPFGHGLSYATFSYDSFNIELRENKGLAEITVTNLSSFAAEEVIQLYVSVADSYVERPHKKLIGFKRELIAANQSARITIEFELEHLHIWDVSLSAFIFEQATYHFMVGQSSEHIQLQQTLKLKGIIPSPRQLTQWTNAESFDDYGSIELDEYRDGISCVRPLKGFGFIHFRRLQLNHPTTLYARVCGGKVGGMLIVKSNGSIVGSSHLVASEEKQWKLVTIELTAVKEDLMFELTGSVKLSQFKLLKGESSW